MADVIVPSANSKAWADITAEDRGEGVRLRLVDHFYRGKSEGQASRGSIYFHSDMEVRAAIQVLRAYLPVIDQLADLVNE